MNTVICGCEDIERMALHPFETGTALISIGDTDTDMPKMKYKPSWLLSLQFDDISNDEINDYRGWKYTLFDEEAANKIAKFISAHEKKIGVLICQCEHGQSRSAAIAAAVNEFYFKNGISIFSDDRYCPNKLVFGLTLKALTDKCRNKGKGEAIKSLCKTQN